jgi:hypothetical protein
MKKLIILSAIAISGLIYNTADAQIGIHFGFRINTPMVYIPTHIVVEQTPVYEQPVSANYDSNDDYYYLPDVDAYYSVNEQCYYYYDGGNWISAAYLPGEYHDYDWRSARRFEVRSPRPYLHDDVYRSKYNGHEIAEWAHNNNEHFDRNNANQGYRSNEQHFDNREQNSYNQHADNRGQGGFNHPTQPNRNQEGNNQHFDNRGQSGHNQPSNQNNGGSRDMKGNGEHFAQNSPKGGLENHRMARF